VLLRLAGFEVSLRHCRPTTPTQITQIRRASPDDTEKQRAGAERGFPNVLLGSCFVTEAVPTAPNAHTDRRCERTRWRQRIMAPHMATLPAHAEPAMFRSGLLRDRDGHLPSRRLGVGGVQVLAKERDRR
jgi:hypothetical protein